MAIICIDPGHGGSDPGAIGPAGTRECDVTMAVALQLRDVLAASGHDVMMTRDADVDVSYPNSDATMELQSRCDVANNAGSDVFISVHCNAAETVDAHGTETWYCAGSRRGEQLAARVDSQVAALGLVDRGAKAGRLYVLRYTAMPAILVETAFISTPTEEQWLCDPAAQANIAAAIARGVTAWLSI